MDLCSISPPGTNNFCLYNRICIQRAFLICRGSAASKLTKERNIQSLLVESHVCGMISFTRIRLMMNIQSAHEFLGGTLEYFPIWGAERQRSCIYIGARLKIKFAAGVMLPSRSRIRRAAEHNVTLKERPARAPE